MRQFKERRRRIAKALPADSALVLESAPVHFRQPEIAFPYRQESAFYWLTGWTEPESLFLLTKNLSALFIRKKDPVKELWEGKRLSAKEAKEFYLMDKTAEIQKWEEKPDLYLKGIKTVFSTGVNPRFSKKLKSLRGVKKKSAQNFLRPHRQIKDVWEIKTIREAVKISAEAHKEIAKALKPGVSERALHGVFLKAFMERGAQREGYSGIFAAGENALCLHYTADRSICRRGELLLADAGAEKDYYTADLTRIYPVNGRFSPMQRKAYSALLSLQKSLIQEIRPEADWKILNEKMRDGATEILIELGALKGSLSRNLKRKTFQPYLPHSLGHHLGLDVHDPAFPPKKQKKPWTLKPGMVLTAEPGIYFPKNFGPIKSLRGTGFRIEDDILVTKTGCENLSRSLPKEPDEIEALCSA